MKNTKKAFTLVELLIVVAIIGVLMSLLMPMMSSVKGKTTAMQTKTFLSSLSSALEIYESEYGTFPDFLLNNNRVNLSTGSYSEYMVKTLTGRSPEGRELSTADKKSYNLDAKRFLDFTDDNLIQKDGSTKWSIVDAGGNPNIYICVDDDADGIIRTGFPTAGDGLSSAEAKEVVPNRQVGIRATAIAFTLEKDQERNNADYPAQNVYSWKK